MSETLVVAIRSLLNCLGVRLETGSLGRVEAQLVASPTMAHVTSAVRYVLSHGLLVKKKQWTSYRSRNHHCSDLMGETLVNGQAFLSSHTIYCRKEVYKIRLCVFGFFFFFPLQLVAGLCKNTCRMRMLTGEEKQKKKKKNTHTINLL